MDRDLDCLLELSCADGLQRQNNTLGATPVSREKKKKSTEAKLPLNCAI